MENTLMNIRLQIENLEKKFKQIRSLGGLVSEADQQIMEQLKREENFLPKKNRHQGS